MHRAYAHALTWAQTTSRALSTRVPHPKPLLATLPKAQGPVKSVKFRRSVPGSAANILYVSNGQHKGLVDPRHPGAREVPLVSLARSMPDFNGPAFSLRIIPNGLLSAPEAKRPFSRNDDYGVTHRRGPPGQEGDPLVRVSMTMLFSKLAVRSNYIRNRIRQRLRTAVALVVSRDARVEGETRELRVADGIVNPEDLHLKDWCYIFTPTALLYRMPMSEMVGHVREAMSKVRSRALTMERRWADVRAGKVPQQHERTGSSKNRQWQSRGPPRRW